MTISIGAPGEAMRLRLLARQGVVNQHYGQTCCTIHRVFVDEKIAHDFIDAECAFFKGLKIGYQADEGTQLGAVINRTQHRRILQAQQETVARGGKPLLAGGEASVSGKSGFLRSELRGEARVGRSNQPERASVARNLPRPACPAHRVDLAPWFSSARTLCCQSHCPV
jgi:hypothetical protein